MKEFDTFRIWFREVILWGFKTWPELNPIEINKLLPTIREYERFDRKGDGLEGVEGEGQYTAIKKASVNIKNIFFIHLQLYEKCF